MASVWLREIAGRTGSAVGVQSASYTRTLLNLRDSRYDNQFDVFNTSGIPKYNSPFPPDPRAILRRINARQTTYPFVWRIDLGYEKPDANENLAEENDDPFQRPPVVEITHESRVEYPEVDLDGKELKNTAGQWFEPLGVERRIPTLRIIRNEAAVSVPFLLDYNDVTNTDSFANVDPGLAKLHLGRISYVFEPEVIFASVEYQIRFNREGWKLKVLNRGRAEKLANGDLKVIVDDVTGQPLADPVLLDEDGLRLADGADPHVLEFRFYEERAFGALQLPEPFIDLGATELPEPEPLPEAA